jgi:hypothetical protein
LIRELIQEFLKERLGVDLENVDAFPSCFRICVSAPRAQGFMPQIVVIET